MNRVKKDLKQILNRDNGENIKKFDTLYARTNEDLKSIFEIIDVKDKNVLAVLASSDYLLSSLYQGVANIDTFDINGNTYRYYYLRKWLIKNGYIDALNISTTDIYKMILEINHKSKAEKENIIFWKSILKLFEFKNNRLYNNTDLFIYTYPKKMIYEDNIEELSYILDGQKELNFSCLNISNGYKSDKKYDVIYLSNIMDYNRINKWDIHNICNNLEYLLEDNGKIIMSHFSYFPNFNTEKNIFSEKFNYVPLNIRDYAIEYYIYEKKKNYTNGIKIKTL